MSVHVYASASNQTSLGPILLIGREKLPEEFSSMKHSITIYYFNSGTC